MTNVQFTLALHNCNSTLYVKLAVQMRISNLHFKVAFQSGISMLHCNKEMHVTLAFQVCTPNWHFKLVFQISNSELQFTCVLQTNMSNYNINTHQQWAQQRRPTISVRSHKARASTAACNVKMDTYSRPISTTYSKQLTQFLPSHRTSFNSCMRRETRTNNEQQIRCKTGTSLTTKQTQQAPKPTHHTGPAFTKHKLQQLRAMWEQNQQWAQQRRPTIKFPISQSTSFNSCMQRENEHLQQATKHNILQAKTQHNTKQL